MSKHDEHTIGEAVDAALERLKRAPLVWIEDGFFIVRDERTPGMRYDFRCKGAGEALAWVEHLSEKSWITTEHLQQFASLAIAAFGVRRP